MTAARYAGEETVLGARCRKIAVTAGVASDALTVWVDDEHIRQIRAVTVAVGTVSRWRKSGWSASLALRSSGACWAALGADGS